MESIRAELSRALLLDTDEIDYEALLGSLRELRSSLVRPDDCPVTDDSLLSALVAVTEKVFRADPRSSESKLTFGVAVQCLVNLMAGNDLVRRICAEKYLKQIIGWLETDECKHQNFVCAALLNIDKVGCLGSDGKLTRGLIDAAKAEVEFAVLLLQNILEKHQFVAMFEGADEDGKLFLLELLTSVLPDQCADYQQEVVFVSNIFKRSADSLMSAMATISALAARKLALEIELLATVSHQPGCAEVLQQDASLIITASYLLRGVHECVSQKTTWKENFQAAVDSINGEDEGIQRKPFFGVKGDLIRLLGNLAHRHEGNQNQIREAGCLPIILDSCKLDADNPFIREWSVLAIRNLCEGNPENQQFINNLNFKKCDIAVDDSLSLTLSEDGPSPVRIAPIKKL